MADAGAEIFEFQLVGYFPKATKVPAEWTGAAQVHEICSVSHCISQAPEHWIDRWTHNELGFFNTPADSWATVPSPPDGFQLFAYRLLPLRFVKGSPEPFSVRPLSVEPLGPNTISLGFDAVSRSVSAFFECSPLSCNGMAAHAPVNRYCLVETVEEAVALAEEFSREEPEPGPYYVFEVLRNSDS